MNKHGMFKKALSLLLCAVIFAGLGLSGVTANAAGKKITDYSVGDIVEFGWYPQSKVTDSSVISQLTSKAGDNKSWTSYDYYSGTGDWYDGKMTASDYMRYTDVVIDGNKYRGVVFDSYRPYCTGYTLSNTYQDNNGYRPGKVYWFKYEPVKWRVLDPSSGMVMSETILDSQAFNNYDYSDGSQHYGNVSKTHYSNNYEKSDIREWLNDDFYNTAFSGIQKNVIATTALNNSAYSTSYSKYDSAITNDKIYLLSYADAVNTSYGFSSYDSEYDTSRQAQGSDYAKSQGLETWYYDDVVHSDVSYWRLRSAGNRSYDACGVYSNGDIYYRCSASLTNSGIRPAFNFNPKSEIIQCKVTDIGSSDTNDNFPDFLDWLRSFFNAIIEWLKSLFDFV